MALPKWSLGTACAAVFMVFGASAFSADVYVAPTDGNRTDLSNEQLAHITFLVKKNVSNHAENYLVDNENDADFSLEPIVIDQGDGRYALRIEKVRDGEVVAIAEETLPSTQQSDSVVTTLTDRAETAGGSQAGNPPSNVSPGYESENGVPNGAYENGSTSGSTTGAYENGNMQGMPSYRDQRRTQTGTESGYGSSYTPSGGMITGERPRVFRAARLAPNDFYTLAVGPGFPGGLGNGSPMLNVGASYDHFFAERLAGKVFGDLNLGSTSNNARFDELGAGVDTFFSSFVSSRPNDRTYASADLGYGYARNSSNQTLNDVAIGAGVGYMFAVEQFDYNVGLHYAISTGQIASVSPSMLNLQAAVNF